MGKLRNALIWLAERVGFEPTVPCGTPDFESLPRFRRIRRSQVRSSRAGRCKGLKRGGSGRFPRTLAAALPLALTACGGSSHAATQDANNVRVCHHYRTQRAWVKNLAEPSLADALKWMGWVAADAGEATPGTQLAHDLGGMYAGMQKNRNIYPVSTRVLKDCEALGVTFQP